MRLRGLFTGDLTWRELGVLIRGLPPTSRLRQAIAGGAQPWTVTDYLLANVHDVLTAANWQRSGEGKSKYPKPLPRPEDRRRRRGEDSPERAAARKDAIRRARERERAIAAGEIT